MALDLPSWVVIAFNYAGLPWPGIDEDELRAWAASVRTFAGNVSDNSARTRAVAAGLADSQQSSFTDSMAARWEHHDQLIADLHEPLNVFADALDVAADVVVAQKTVVIGAAIAFATEFAATQIGAFFTLGADEAALPEEIISTREIVDFAIEELKGALIGELLNGAVQEISDHVSQFIGNLLSGGLQVVTEYQSLRLSYGYLRSAASAMRGQASETEATGDSAYAENANRDLEDPGEGAADSGFASVVQAVKQALLDLALALFKSLPQAIMRAQEDSAAEIDAAAARVEDTDSAAGHAAPHDTGHRTSAEAGTGAAVAGTGIVQPQSGLDVSDAPGSSGNYVPVSAENGSPRLFKRLFPELAEVNAPRYGLGPQWRRNCQSCVNAVDNTLDGNPVQAIPRPPKGFAWPDSVTKTIGGGKPFVKVSGYDDITDQMTKAGDGARGVVWGRRFKQIGGRTIEVEGHVFNVVNRGGRVFYVDGQTGRFARLENFPILELLRTH